MPVVLMVILSIIGLGCYIAPFFCLRNKWNIMLQAVSTSLAVVALSCLFHLNYLSGYGEYHRMVAALSGYCLLFSSAGIHWNYFLATKLKTARRSLLVASLLFDFPFLFLFFILYHNPEGPPKEDWGLLAACWIYLFAGALFPLLANPLFPRFGGQARSA